MELKHPVRSFTAASSSSPLLFPQMAPSLVSFTHSCVHFAMMRGGEENSCDRDRLLMAQRGEGEKGTSFLCQTEEEDATRFQPQRNIYQCSVSYRSNVHCVFTCGVADRSISPQFLLSFFFCHFAPNPVIAPCSVHQLTIWLESE